MIVQYTKPHTISGLDGATESTLTAALNNAAINGGAYYACVIRSAATIESNNVAQDVAGHWTKAAAMWRDIFKASMRQAKYQANPQAEPATAAWNDPQHSEIYP